jgi:hypothetical protein
VVRGLLVTLFLLESVGILLVSLVISVLIDGSLLDGPPVPARSRLVLTLATIACFVAVAGAAVEASGLFDRMRVAPRLAVLGAAVAVNILGLVEAIRWSVLPVALSCVLGCAASAYLAATAFRSRPMFATLADELTERAAT